MNQSAPMRPMGGAGKEQAVSVPQHGELRDDLIFPAYDQFCRDNGFNLPGGDIKLQAEAMALFNQCKPHYSYFRGYVVHFHVWSREWDFLHTTKSVEEFLAEAAHDQKRLKKFEKWFGIVAGAVIFLTGLACVMTAFDRWLRGWWVLIIFAVAVWAGWKWFFVIVPNKKQARNQEALLNQLGQFRQKLSDIQVAKETKHGL